MKKSYLLILLFIIFILSNKSSYSQTNYLNNSLDININWQVLDSYTPTFYEGKALPGEEASIKAVVEIFDTVDNNTNDLFYDWYYNDFYLYKYSKIGGKKVYFTLDKLENINKLKVQIYNTDKTILLAEKSIEIKPYKSLALIYKKSDINLLTYANAVNKKYTTYNIGNNNNFNIIAEPFYFSTKTPTDKNISYAWTKNGVIGNVSYSNETTLSLDKKSKKNINLSLKIQNNNVNKNLQEASSIVVFE